MVPFETPLFLFARMGKKEQFMKKLFKKFAAIGMAAMMIMAMGVTAFAAESEEQYKEIPIAATLYKDGTFGTDEQDESMGNPAFSKGGVMKVWYTVDESGDEIVTQTQIVLDTSSVTYMGFITGWMTELNIDGVQFETTAMDGDGNITQFTGTYHSEIVLGQAYDATVNISVGGFMPMNSQGDIVFTAQ